MEKLREAYKIKYDPYKLSEGQTKLGDSKNNLVVGPNYIHTNIEATTNPGFTFTSSGSYIRPGKKLVLEADYKYLLFGGGTQQINPQGENIASCVPNPLPTITPSVESLFGGAGWALSKVVGEVLKQLENIS